LAERDVLPVPGGPTNRSVGSLIDDERGSERGADGGGFRKGMVISLEGEIHRAGLSVSIEATVLAC